MKNTATNLYTKYFTDPVHVLAHTCLINEPYYIHMEDIRQINQMCTTLYHSVSTDDPIVAGKTAAEAIGMREFYKDLNAYRRTHKQLSPVEEAAYITAKMIYEPVFEERNNQTALLSGVYCLEQAGYDIDIDPYWMVGIQEKLYIKNEFEEFSDYVTYFESFYEEHAKLNEATLDDTKEEEDSYDLA